MSQPHRISRLWLQRGLRSLGLALFGFYLFRAQGTLRDTLARLADMGLGEWALACLFYGSTPLLLALRQQRLLRTTGHVIGYRTLLLDSLRSGTLNTVTLMGAGDVYRMTRLRAEGVPLATGSAVVVLDRLFGVGTLVLVIIGFQLLGWGRLRESASPMWVGLALFMSLALFAVIAHRTIARVLRDRVGFLTPVLDSGALGPRSVGPLVAISLAICAGWIYSVRLLGLGLGLDLGLAPYVEAAPLVALAAMLPITIGGVGLRETGYVLLLGAYGADAAQCIALGLAQYSVGLALAGVGALCFLAPGASRRRHA